MWRGQRWPQNDWRDVTAHGGRQLRLIRNGVLDPQPIAGVPESRALIFANRYVDDVVN